MKYPFQSLAWLMLCVASSSFAASPSSVLATYDVYKGSIKGATITETYTRKQNRYAIESVSQAVGLLALIKPETIRYTSEGEITDHGLRPLTFIGLRKLDTDRNVRADFDWKAKRLALTEHGQQRILPLPDGTQDRLSAMYQFMFLSLAKTDVLSFHMTNGGKLDVYNYRITPDQNVTVPLGTFKGLYVASVPEADASRTEIWLAGEHANFPYKMIITDKDGEKFSQVLTKFVFVP
ncbi:MAG: DUF3108 domain-containing protein [Gallionella sp.]